MVRTNDAKQKLLHRIQCMKEFLGPLHERIDELTAHYAGCCDSSSSSSSSSTSSSSSSSSSSSTPSSSSSGEPWESCTVSCEEFFAPYGLNEFTVVTGAFIGNPSYELPSGVLSFYQIPFSGLSATAQSQFPSAAPWFPDPNDYRFYACDITTGSISGDKLIIAIAKHGISASQIVFNFTNNWNPINSTATTAIVASTFVNHLTNGVVDLYAGSTLFNPWEPIVQGETSFGDCVSYLGATDFQFCAPFCDCERLDAIHVEVNSDPGNVLQVSSFDYEREDNPPAWVISALTSQFGTPDGFCIYKAEGILTDTFMDGIISSDNTVYLAFNPDRLGSQLIRAYVQTDINLPFQVNTYSSNAGCDVIQNQSISLHDGGSLSFS